MSMPGNLSGAVDLSGLVRRAQAPQASAPGAQGAEDDAMVFVADDQSFGRVVELSQRVPVIVEFVDERTPPTGVDAVIASYGGRIALARVDAMVNPQLVQAFRVDQIPLFAAVIGGRPLPLFAGVLVEAELRQVLDQVLQVAGQQGVTGSVPAGDAEGPTTAEPAEQPLLPLHQEAYEAIDAGDYDRAVKAYEQAIRENPRDELAAAGLAQVKLLQRLGSAEGGADEADRAFAAGDVEGAFETLLGRFPEAAQEERDSIRARLLDYFEILGPEDPRVGPARRRLSSLLY